MLKSTVSLAVALLPLSGGVFAYPVSTTFTINPAQSNLTVNASSLFFTDSDANSLNGTLDAVFDFGSGGVFPASAGVTFTDAEITPSGSYELRLGFPPLLGVDITASNLLAHVTTPTPPATMSKTAAPGAVYQFDASQFLLTVDQGTIAVTGSTNETNDLSEEPVSGASPAGTLGSVTFTMLGTSGPYTQLAAALDLPIRITETAESESSGLAVDLELVATVRASATFYVALGGVPGDFDLDGDVDALDLTAWRASFGAAGAPDGGRGDADGDGDSDGNDFLMWQRNVGTAPPSVNASVVPEGSSVSLIFIALAALGRRGLTRRPWSGNR